MINGDRSILCVLAMQFWGPLALEWCFIIIIITGGPNHKGLACGGREDDGWMDGESHFKEQQSGLITCSWIVVFLHTHRNGGEIQFVCWFNMLRKP